MNVLLTEGCTESLDWVSRSNSEVRSNYLVSLGRACSSECVTGVQ